ncbi:MAG: hypothetical protein GY842_19480 [bacterium]|nr:hypothetical protein [bacterium]
MIIGVRWRAGLAGLTGAVLVWSVGCSSAEVDWPRRPVLGVARNGDTMVSYDLSGSGVPDYVQRMQGDRKTVLYFDADEDGRPDEEVRLDACTPDWPHYLIVLDGVPHQLVARMWDDGRFRLFGRPSKVISTYPSMTDLALSRLLGTAAPAAIEAVHFDEQSNRICGGDDAYNRGANSPWLEVLTYHAPQSIGARAYLDPQGVFARELREMRAAFDRVDSGLASAYSVGTAGLGTRGGEAAIEAYLEVIDRFCERLMYDRRGRVRITLVADHGHSLTPCKRIGFKRHLAAHGFRLTDSLRRAEDVVTVKYGLVNLAQFFTPRPAEVARALLAHPAADIASFRVGERVMVLSAEGEAEVHRRGGGYAYTTTVGDPLRLNPIIEVLTDAGQVAKDGTIYDRSLSLATADHVYPDPLHRLWNCFDGAVHNPPSVVLSLKDGYCHGSWLFEAGIGRVASTHGALDQTNSATFVMSTAGGLPKVLRIGEVMQALEAGIAPHKPCSDPGGANSLHHDHQGDAASPPVAAETSIRGPNAGEGSAG